MAEQFPKYSNPLHQYRAEDVSGSSAVDSGYDVSSRNNGTITGATVVDGFLGRKAFDFAAGTDQIDTGLNKGNNPISVFGRFKLDTLTLHQGIFGKFNASGRIYFGISNGGVEFLFGLGSAASAVTSLLPETGRWYSFAITYSGSQWYGYIDGIEVVSATNSNLSGTENYLIGFVNGFTNHLDGQVQDILVFDYALTAEEVRYLSNYGFYNNVAVDEELIPDIYFPCDEIEGPLKSIGKNTLETISTNGSPTFLAAGKDGFNCIDFEDSTNDYFGLDTTYPISNWQEKSVTILCWATVESLATENSIIEIVDTGGDIILLSVGGSLSGGYSIRALVRGNNGAQSCEIRPFDGGLAGTGFHWWALSFDWSTKTLDAWIDGTSKGTSQNLSMTNLMDSGSYNRFTFGQSSGNREHDGKIQHFKVFHGKALTLDQIQEAIKFNYSGTKLQFPGNDSLVLWNKLGSLSEAESSEIGKDGTVTGAVAYSSAKFGDGIDCVGTGERVVFNGVINKQQGAISFWWKPNYDHTISESYIVIDSPESSRFVMYHNNTTQQFRWGHSAGQELHEQTFSSGNLYHIGIVWDLSEPTNKMKLFFDNVHVDSNTYDFSSDTVSENLALGGIFGGSTGFNANCQYDNVKVYNYPKTDFSDDMLYEAPTNLLEIRK